MQTVLKDNDKFFKQLRERRRDILARRRSAPPVGLGWRVAQMDDPQDYGLVIYYKGPGYSTCCGTRCSTSAA